MFSGVLSTYQFRENLYFSGQKVESCKTSMFGKKSGHAYHAMINCQEKIGQPLLNNV
jgi:hypothetical protein